MGRWAGKNGASMILTGMRYATHRRPAPGAEDLLDAAAIQTMLRGGTVFTMAPEAVPEGSPIAAILRY